MIHFDCPNCGERMDIDSGFRGAVARCEKCGALIQVPTKAKAAPQRIERPKKPTAPPPPNPKPNVTRDTPAHSGARPWLIAFVVVVILLALGGAYAWWRIRSGTP